MTTEDEKSLKRFLVFFVTFLLFGCNPVSFLFGLIAMWTYCKYFERR